jgi:hypothetical protein
VVQYIGKHGLYATPSSTPSAHSSTSTSKDSA